MITLAQLSQICKEAPAATLQHFIAPLNDAFAEPKFCLDTDVRQAAFLAQAAHETHQFTRLEESLNYSAEGLVATFPRYFTPALAAEYARKPQAIANRVYADRGGNGSESSGDGWLYRGRGIPHVTFKNNYRACSIAITGDAGTLLQNPELLADPDYAVFAGAWYWAENELHKYADRGQFDAICDVINKGRVTPQIGDTNGYADRVAFWKRAEGALA